MWCGLNRGDRLFKRIYNLCRQGWTILDTQTRVVAVLNLPNFQHEEKKTIEWSHLEFRSIRIRKLQYVWDHPHPVD